MRQTINDRCIVCSMIKISKQLRSFYKTFQSSLFYARVKYCRYRVTHLLWTAAGSKADKPNICSKCVHKLSDLREKRAVTLVFSDPVRLVQTYRLNDNLSNRYIFNFVNLQRIEALLLLQLRNVNFADRYIDLVYV